MSKIYRHALNKGGLDEILATQRLIATEARGVRGGASAVRAMDGPWHLPYKGDNPGIEFTTTIEGTPQKFAGMDGTTWFMPEGDYLDIKVTKVVYPDGRVVTYDIPAPAPVLPDAPPVEEDLPPPPAPEVPIVRPPNVGSGRLVLESVKAGLKEGWKGIWSAENLVFIAAEVFMAVADHIAAKTAARRIQVFFIKEGFAKGLAAGVMGWTEDEVAGEAMNRVTEFRLEGMGDAAGHLKLDYMFKLATAYENYAVGVGYYWSRQKSLGWQQDVRQKGLAYLKRTGYDNWGTDEDVLYHYEFLSKLAWALRQQSDDFVEAHIRD